MTDDRKLEIRRWLLEALVDPTRVLETDEVAHDRLSGGARLLVEEAGHFEVGEPPPTYIRAVVATDGGGSSITRFDLADVSIELGKVLSAAARDLGATAAELLEVLAVVALRASVGAFAGEPAATPVEIELEELHERILLARTRADLAPIERLVADQVERLPVLRNAYARAMSITVHVRAAMEARARALGE